MLDMCTDFPAILQKLGFREVRQRGSQKNFAILTARVTTVPLHQGRDISPIFWRQVAKDIGVTVDELLKQR
jgi:predicted RNA binding protein YcfA (HicA-like mRNA interferase family)